MAAAHSYRSIALQLLSQIHNHCGLTTIEFSQSRASSFKRFSFWIWWSFVLLCSWLLMPVLTAFSSLAKFERYFCLHVIQDGKRWRPSNSFTTFSKWSWPREKFAARSGHSLMWWRETVWFSSQTHLVLWLWLLLYLTFVQNLTKFCVSYSTRSLTFFQGFWGCWPLPVAVINSSTSWLWFRCWRLQTYWWKCVFMKSSFVLLVISWHKGRIKRAISRVNSKTLRYDNTYMLESYNKNTLIWFDLIWFHL